LIVAEIDHAEIGQGSVSQEYGAATRIVPAPSIDIPNACLPGLLPDGAA